MTAYTEEIRIQELQRAWMDEAINLATNSVANGGGPFGAGGQGQRDRRRREQPGDRHPGPDRARRGERDARRLQGAGHVLPRRLRPDHLVRAVRCASPRPSGRASTGSSTAPTGTTRRWPASTTSKFYELFEKKPASLWPTPVEQLELPTRTAPFNAWLAKSDRVDY